MACVKAAPFYSRCGPHYILSYYILLTIFGGAFSTTVVNIVEAHLLKEFRD